MNKSYKKPRSPYIILIVFFFLLAAFDSVFIESKEEQKVTINVANSDSTEQVEPYENYIAKYLIYLPNNE